MVIWQKLEREMAQIYIGTAAKTGDFVHLQMTLNYKKYVRRPDSFDVNWEHMRGTSIVKSIPKKTISNPE